MEFTFEFDPQKSASNQVKHGVDFVEAQILWQDPDGETLPLPYVDELRWIVIGRLKGKLWSAIYTVRDGRVRIISVRRSRPKEEKAYAERRP